MKRDALRRERHAAPQNSRAHGKVFAVRSLLARAPLAVWLIALAAAIVHLAPLWRAQLSVADGWEFTGNLATSPDYMQYRVWERRTEFTGPIADNRFTTEAHQRYLPVLLYWFVGIVARTVGQPPEFVYEWLGAPLAFALVLLLYLCAQRFLSSRVATWWVFLSTLLGGGLGAYLKLADEQRVLGERWTAWLNERLANAPVWESYRSHYVCKVLFDTHFLVAWVFTILALLAYHAALQRPSAVRVAAASLASVFVTALHPYEGPLLVLIHAVTLGLARWRGVADRNVLVASATVAAATAASVLALLALQSQSGLPIPSWRPPDVAWINVLLAYPIVALLAVFGLRAYWSRAGLDQVFLLGWAGGCLLMTLSSPLYPYADRGPTTAQAPLFLVAGGIYFARRSTVHWTHALIALVSMGVSAPRDVLHRWRVSHFDRKRPAIFVSGEHRDLLERLRALADEKSVLLAQPREYRWLAPQFPGVSYHAHFFLTVEFERKFAEVESFFASKDALEQARFLEERGIDFLHVPREAQPERFEALPGWRAVAQADGGVLLEREARDD